ncbi:MAG: hypothetical protein JJV89_00180 [Desulfosarcina sp.]|nr:hypothetical protein [Desulfobacterales bacterium]
MIKDIFKESFFQVILIASVLFAGLYFYNELINNTIQRSYDKQLRMAVVGALGEPCIPIIAQCCTSRNISEGIYARRSDIVGGFCFHSDCDVVHIKKLYSEKFYTLKIKGLVLIPPID